MDLTTLVSGHLRYLGLGSPLIGIKFNSIELQAPVWRLGKERQLAQQYANSRIVLLGRPRRRRLKRTTDTAQVPRD